MTASITPNHRIIRDEESQDNILPPDCYICAHYGITLFNGYVRVLKRPRTALKLAVGSSSAPYTPSKSLCTYMTIIRACALWRKSLRDKSSTFRCIRGPA